MLGTIEKWFLLFILYGFAGWLYESALRSVRAHKLVNSGFLNGPLCPIYGVGAICVILVLSPLKGRPLLLFFSGAVLTTSIEYVTGAVMERLFHARWWDYSQRFFNIRGRVCLLGFMAFGLMSVLLVEYIQPVVESWPPLFTDIGKHAVSAIILAAVLFDLAVTLWSVLKVEARLRSLRLAISGRLPALPRMPFVQINRLMDAFPALDFTQYREEWKRFKTRTYFPRHNDTEEGDQDV